MIELFKTSTSPNPSNTQKFELLTFSLLKFSSQGQKWCSKAPPRLSNAPTPRTNLARMSDSKENNSSLNTHFECPLCPKYYFYISFKYKLNDKIFTNETIWFTFKHNTRHLKALLFKSQHFQNKSTSWFQGNLLQFLPPPLSLLNGVKFPTPMDEQPVMPNLPPQLLWGHINLGCAQGGLCF